MGYLEPFSFEVILPEHESEDQPTPSEGFQVDVLYQMSLLEPAIQHQPEGDTTVRSYLLVWLKEMMVLQKTLFYRKCSLKEKKTVKRVNNLKRTTFQEEQCKAVTVLIIKCLAGSQRSYLFILT